MGSKKDTCTWSDEQQAGANNLATAAMEVGRESDDPRIQKLLKELEALENKSTPTTHREPKTKTQRGCCNPLFWPLYWIFG